MGMLGYSFSGVQHGLWKGNGVHGSGCVCANIHGQVNGLGTDIYIFSSSKSVTKEIVGIANSFAMEGYGGVFCSISGVKTFGLRLHHQPA